MPRRSKAKFKAEKMLRNLNNILGSSKGRAERAKGTCIQKHDGSKESRSKGKYRLRNTDSEVSSTDGENKENRKAAKKIPKAARMNGKLLKCSTRVQLQRKGSLPSSRPLLSSPSSSSLSSSLSSSSPSLSSSSLSSTSSSSSSSRPTSSESSASRTSSSSLSSSSTSFSHSYDEDAESDESCCHCGDV